VDCRNNFDHAFDRDGQPVAFKNIQVTGTVDSQHPGKYQVTYRYHGLQQVATITVQPLAPTTPQPGSKPTPQPAPKPTVTHKKVTSQSARKKATSSTKQLPILPRTDETTSTVLLVAGLVLLLFSGLALTRSFNDRH
jgi:Bacterial Ig-like domain (group 3).